MCDTDNTLPLYGLNSVCETEEMQGSKDERARGAGEDGRS